MYHTMVIDSDMPWFSISYENYSKGFVTILPIQQIYYCNTTIYFGDPIHAKAQVFS